MAEYYPLLAKAVGSLPNSTPETRRVVYERARKALIGQLRTLHPPVPDDDIERESVELDRAVERLEGELASGGVPAQPAPVAVPAPRPAPAPIIPPRPPARPASVLPEATAAGERKPLRARMPVPKTAERPAALNRRPSGAIEGGDAAVAELPAAAPPPVVEPVASPVETERPIPEIVGTEDGGPVGTAAADAGGRVRLDTQRPLAPQPARNEAGRRLWIIPLGIGIVVAVVAVAAWKLRDTRQSVAHVKPAEQTARSENGKIAERVGGAAPSENGVVSPPEAAPAAAPPAEAPATEAKKAAALAAAANPELPVAHRAALLVEAPDEPNKVKTYLGSVVWKLDNVNNGPGDTVGLAVEADVDLPDDKMKAVVTFEKNSDASLPASHTIKVRFSVDPGSTTGGIQQISVPQLRQEDSPSGEALAGVTVPVVQNSFLVGLSPGNAEAVNIKQLKDMQWIDIPMLLSNGKIAKLTFEKGESGQRDLSEAIAAWAKS